MRRLPAPFAFLVPCLGLIVSLTILAAPATLLYFSLQQMARGGSNAYLHAGNFSMTIPRERFVMFAITSAAVRFGHIVDALNIPGTLGEALFSMTRAWPHSLVPAGMTLDAWRALSLPVFCLPAWWLVGRGVDSLNMRGTLHWALCLVGTLLCVGCCVLAIGLRFGTDAADRMDETWPLWGMAVWVVLFSVLPFAWWRQWRRLRVAALSSPGR